MEETTGETVDDKKNERVILNPQRRQRLMKKLENIKLNRSKGNNSFVDFSAIYEARARKMKINNISLAKALAEQRQICQSWYNEVITLKSELHDKDEKLIHYQVKDSGDQDIIDAAVQRRITEIMEPLEAAVKECLVNVFGLVDNMTKVKQIVSSLLKTKNEKKTRSRSHGSVGSRPPLSRTPKSPRKNVVHPMVEGHVLQPASIHIPRMRLEDRRRYHLHDRTEAIVAEDPVMSVIGEHSTSDDSHTENPASSSAPVFNTDTVSASENIAAQSCSVSPPELPLSTNVLPEEMESPPFSSAPSPEPHGNMDASPEEALNPDSESSSLENSSRDTECEDQTVVSGGVNTSPLQRETTQVSALPTEAETDALSCKPVNEEELMESNSNNEKTLTSKHKQARSADDEDPLEGSSWMHVKKKRNSKTTRKRSSRCSRRNPKRTSGMHFLVSDSSDDSGEDQTIDLRKVKKRTLKQKISIIKTDSPKGSPTPVIAHLDNKVSRRSKKPLSLPNKNNCVDKNEEHCQEELRSVPLESFIINETLKENDVCLQSSEDRNQSSPSEGIQTQADLATPGDSKGDQGKSYTGKNSPVNVTCIFDSPMEMTRCLAKDIQSGIVECAVSAVSCDKYVFPKYKSCDTKTDISVEDNTSLSVREKLEVVKRQTSVSSDQNRSLHLFNDQNVPSDHEINGFDGFEETNSPSGKDGNSTEENVVLVVHNPKKNKFFKCGIDETSVKDAKDSGRTPYDISLLDISSVDNYIQRKGKENIPPRDRSPFEKTSDDVALKLKNVSVIVEDIMKTPTTFSCNEFSSHKSPVSNSVDPVSSTNKNTKRKVSKNRDRSPSRKVSKKQKKINFTDPEENYTDLSSDENDVWSPSKVRTKTKSKKINRRKEKINNSNSKLNSRTKGASDSEDLCSKKQNSKTDGVKEKFKLGACINTASIKGDKASSVTDTDAEAPQSDCVPPESNDICTVTLKTNNISASPVLPDIIQEVNNLVLNNLAVNNEKDPLALNGETDPCTNDNLDDHDDGEPMIIAVINKFPPHNRSLEETLKSRPRRAAIKVSSFKEPSLSVKLRRESSGKSTKRNRTLKKTTTKS